MLQPSATLRAVRGMVCAVDHLAAQAGLSMLHAAGSAADAAVAASAVLAVTTQNQCGMGGDLLAVVSSPGAEPAALNASGFAGQGSDAQALRDAGYAVMPVRDHLATVTVPGCVDGWLALHKRFGRLPVATVLEPARAYAAEGFPAAPSLVEDVGSVAHLPAAADYTGVGELRPGTVVRRPGVARTLEAIASRGRDGFYLGECGMELLEIGRGQFSPEDLSRPIAAWVPAINAPAFGHRLWTVPPNSQGYLTLAAAAIASGLELPGDPDDPLWAHLLVESARQASFDRIDMLHEGADGRALVDEARLAPRRAAIHPGRAATLGGSYRAGGTIALLAVDRDGMGVSLVQSNASGFGSRIVLPRTRIFLHNRGMGFSLEPGHPAELRPGRRPPHTLCPTVVTRPDGTLAGVLGTAGGDSQPQFLLQILTRWLAGGAEPGDAIAAARFSLANPGGGEFNTWRLGGNVRVLVEGHAPLAWREGLARRGHDVEVGPAYGRGFGVAHLVAVEGGVLAGATEPRTRAGAVAAY